MGTIKENIGILQFNAWAFLILFGVACFGFVLYVLARRDKKEVGALIMIISGFLAVIPVLLTLVASIILALSGWHSAEIWYCFGLVAAMGMGGLVWYVKR